MYNFTKTKLSLSDMNEIRGGRDVRKEDTDGDGKWDVKVVTKDSGAVKVVLRDADGRHVYKYPA